jgi:hypothetical protein
MITRVRRTRVTTLRKRERGPTMEFRTCRYFEDVATVNDAKKKLKYAAAAEGPFFLGVGLRKPHLDFRFPKPFLRCVFARTGTGWRVRYRTMVTGRRFCAVPRCRNITISRCHSGTTTRAHGGTVTRHLNLTWSRCKHAVVSHVVGVEARHHNQVVTVGAHCHKSHRHGGSTLSRGTWSRSHPLSLSD